eukprot:2166706-Rhodomonas_salina.2
MAKSNTRSSTPPLKLRIGLLRADCTDTAALSTCISGIQKGCVCVCVCVFYGPAHLLCDVRCGGRLCCASRASSLCEGRY